MFDDAKPGWVAERAQLRELLDDDAHAQARRTTNNAHYTDPASVQTIWSALDRLGFTRGTVLEPGAGSRTFIGMAPTTAALTGVELDPTTASITRHLYPGAEVRAESFTETRFPSGYFDAVVGNVSFANVTLHDPVHNAGGHSTHNQFIIKSLALTRPGGMVAVLNFRPDAADTIARWPQQNGVRYLSPVSPRPLTLGNVGGHEISIHAAYSLDATRRVELVLALRDVPRTAAHVSQDDLHRGSIGILRQLENKAQSIPRTLQTVAAGLDDQRQEHAAIEHRIGQPSPHTAALGTAQPRVDEVDAGLHARADKTASPSRRASPPTSVPRTPSLAYEPSYG